jgi:protein pelota
MKLLGRHIERDGSGYVQLMPQEPEDLWHAYHLLAVGDILRSTAIR